MPLFRRSGARAAKPDTHAPSEGSASGAGPGRTGRFPVLRVTATAIVLGALLVAVLVVVNSGQDSSAEATSAPTSTSVAPTTPSATTTTPGTSASPSIVIPAVQTPTDIADGRSLGSPDAPVQLDLWSDYQCPACDVFAGSVTPGLVEKYIRSGKARLIYHDIAYLGNESLGAAISARCAERQGKFWEYHDLLFANQAPENSGAFTKARSKQFAAALGLDLKKFSSCLVDTTVEDAVLAETKQGDALGVPETPAVYVNGTIARPATRLDPIAAAIDAALAGS